MSNALIDSGLDILAQNHAQTIFSESKSSASYADLLKIDRTFAYFPNNANSDSVRYVNFSSPPPRQEILDRINELREIADEESIPFKNESASDLLDFLKMRPGACNPDIFLLDNGNLRTVWKCSLDRQIGLQFCGSGKVQFVLFSRRLNSNHATRAAGWDTVSGVGKQISNSELMGLLYQ